MKYKIKNSKILITGGAGFIGSNLVTELLKKGAKRIVIVDNFTRGSLKNLEPHLSNKKVEIVKRDIATLYPDSQFYLNIDYVIHMAVIRVTHAQDDPRLAHDVMATGTFNILDGCAKNNIKKLILISSTSVYGNPNNDLPMKEEDALNNLSIYGAAKIYTEFLLKPFRYLYDLNYVCLRPFNVYGPNMDISSNYQEVIPTWTAAIKNKQPIIIHGDGEQSYDFTYVGDIVKATILALESNINEGIYNAGTGITTSLNTLAKMLLKLTRGKSKIIYRDPGKRIRVSRRICDPTKAKRDLKFTAKVKLEDGLKEFLKWYKETSQN